MGLFSVVGCGGKERQSSPAGGGGMAGELSAAGAPPTGGTAGTLSTGGTAGTLSTAGAAGALEAAGTSGASAGSAGAAQNTGSCEPYCATKADCCSDCSYPNNLDCQDRHCVSLGCTADADCAQTNGPKSICRSVLGFPRCVEPCLMDTDCSNPKAFCSAADDDGDKFCGALPGLIKPCFENADCVGICDLSTHQCGCSADGQCPSGSICAPLE